MIIQFALGIFSFCFLIYIAYHIGYAKGYRIGFDKGLPTQEKLELLANNVNKRIEKTFYDGIERGRHLRDKVNNN